MSLLTIEPGRGGLITASVIAAAGLALAGCNPPTQVAAVEPEAEQAKFNTDLPLNEFMGHVVVPAADMYWKNSGTLIDAAGEHNLAPTTDEGWDVLVSGASIVMEAGNALQLEGRVRAPAADWLRYAQTLTARAAEARAAAERHDEAAVLDAGGKLDEACDACHVRFAFAPPPKT